MKKCFLILAVIALASCAHKPTPQELAEQCMREHAYHPEHLKVLSCNAVLRPERTKRDTFYHIACVDGTKDEHRCAWRNVRSVIYDSIRVETHHYPEHYYCAADIECMNDCGETIRSIGEVAVFPDGSAIMYRTYQSRYYKSIADTVFAASGIFTDVRDRFDLLAEWNGWALRQILMPYDTQNIAK